MLAVVLSILSAGWSFLRTPLGQWVGGIAGALIAFWVWGAWQKSAGRAEVRAEWAAANDAVRRKINAADTEHANAGEQKGRDLASEILGPVEKLKEKSDALEAAIRDRPGCSTDDALGGLPGWDARPRP